MRLLVRAADALKNEQIRFLLVGAWNTVIGYAIFVAVNAVAADRLSTSSVLVVSYLIAVPHSYITQRLLVFKSARNWRLQFLKFFVSNSIVFVSNLLFLPIFVMATGIRPVLAQAIFVALSTIATYILHKNFSFSERRQQGA